VEVLLIKVDKIDIKKKCAGCKTKINTLGWCGGGRMTDLSVVNDEEGEEKSSAHCHGCVGQFPAHKHLSTMTCRQNKTLFFREDSDVEFPDIDRFLYRNIERLIILFLLV
jgi:hypothetical protein